MYFGAKQMAFSCIESNYVKARGKMCLTQSKSKPFSTCINAAAQLGIKIPTWMVVSRSDSISKMLSKNSSRLLIECLMMQHSSIITVSFYVNGIT